MACNSVYRPLLGVCIMVRMRLKMLRPIYLAHEWRVFKAAGLDEFLPKEKKLSDLESQLAALLKKGKDDPSLLERLRAELGN